MNAVETIQAVLNTALLTPELTIIPQRGAAKDEIELEESLVGHSFCHDHAEILGHWNGIALEVVRLFGCGDRAGEVGRISDFQLDQELEVPGGIIIGADASGFVYLQSADERVFSYDSDGGGVKQLANGLDDFFGRLVFGRDAALFAGADWYSQLVNAGIVR